MLCSRFHFDVLTYAAWAQCTTTEFILFVALMALKKAAVSVGAVLYVVVVLAKAFFYERLSGGQRTGVCLLLALNNLLLSIGRDSFGTKVFVGAGVGLAAGLAMVAALGRATGEVSAPGAVWILAVAIGAVAIAVGSATPPAFRAARAEPLAILKDA